jgi:glycosyltransferase involved in cell wall biosynthesis
MGNRAPAISVITIVKNEEELLPRAVHSVLAQSFADFEHIIVNDGSSDGTRAIIDDYAKKDQRVKPRHMPENMGRAMARNAGLDSAQGKYILFVDADDYLPETSLTDLYEVAEQDKADIVFAGVKAFDQTTRTWHQLHYTDYFINHERHKFRLDDYPELVRNHLITGRLYRRLFLIQNNIRFSTTRKNGEDVTFAFYTAFYADSMTMVPERKTYFYSIGNYLATANESKLADARDNMLETLEFALEHGSDTLKRTMRRKAAMFAANLTRVQKVYEGQQQKFLEYIQTLQPLVAGLPNDISSGLSPYEKRFIKAVTGHDFLGAYQAWEEKISMEQQSARRRDKFYNSRLWRITAPLRHNSWFWRITAPLRHNSWFWRITAPLRYNSWFWRLTAPFRWLHRLVLRLGNMQRRS